MMNPLTDSEGETPEEHCNRFFSVAGSSAPG